MKKLILLSLLIYFISVCYSQQNEFSKGVVSSYDGVSCNVYSGETPVYDTLDLFPAIPFVSYWYYFSDSQTPKTANLKVTPPVSWVTVSPTVFTSNNCTHVIPVIFSYSVPQALGTYNFSVVDSNGNYRTIAVTIRVTNNPVKHRADSILIMQSGQTIQKFYKAKWKGLNTSTWVPQGYCGANPFIPGNQQYYLFFKVPEVNWLTINPTNFVVNLNDSILVTKTFNPQPAGLYNVFECIFFQWSTYPRFINWIIYVSSDVKRISSEIPDNFSLSQNYPNPFNPTTTIEFDLPKAEFVILKIYDALGREVQTLVNENLSAGSYSVDWDATLYPSGLYFYKIIAGNFSDTKRMILVK